MHTRNLAFKKEKTKSLVLVASLQNLFSSSSLFVFVCKPLMYSTAYAKRRRKMHQTDEEIAMSKSDPNAYFSLLRSIIIHVCRAVLFPLRKDVSSDSQRLNRLTVWMTHIVINTVCSWAVLPWRLSVAMSMFREIGHAALIARAWRSNKSRGSLARLRRV